MWRDYAPEVVQAELEQLRDLGLTMTRSFLFWPDAMPSCDRLDETVMERFEDFLDRHARLGLRTIPTFIVGHMSGQNWDPVWRDDRDVVADVWFVARQAWYVNQVAVRFADHEAIAAWLLTNEAPIYIDPVRRGVDSIDHRLVDSWAQLLISALRAGGAHQPVSIGDGVWGIETTGRENGFRARDLAGQVDFLGPHVYRMETDQVRESLSAAFVIELNHWGKPVILEEFGVTSDYVGSDMAAAYYRQMLHTSLLAGATGWLAWNNVDFDSLRDSEPYNHHPHEMHFGVIDAAGRPKPQALELSRFSSTITSIVEKHGTLCRPDTDAAIIVSSYLDGDHPFTLPEDRLAVEAAARQAYIASREADLPAALVREADGVSEGLRLYILPSVKQLTAPSWDALVSQAEAGAVIYASAFTGAHSTQRGLWWPDTDSTFGIRRLTRYGVSDHVDDAVVEALFEQDFGSIRAGEVLRFGVGGSDDAQMMIPVAPDGAQVVARDQHGRPFLLEHRLGQGLTVLCTYPIEYYAAGRRQANPEDSWRIYDALAVKAGVRRPIRVDDPSVMCAELDAEQTRLAWLVNLSAEPVAVRPRFVGADHLVGLDGDRLPQVIDLEPFGVVAAVMV
jgi:endo-1,4-beta-mannosidase